MTFLTAAQSASVRLQSRKPSAFWSATGRAFEMEICDLGNDVAADIMGGHDWRLLTTLWEITGNGSVQSWDFPSDYDRMLIKGAVFRPDWAAWHYAPAPSLDFWRDLINGNIGALNPGYWIVLEGQMQFWPVIPAGAKAQAYYISRNIVQPATGGPASQFSSDDDKLRLDERLLTLGLIWRWKAMKGLEYAEDMASYEEMLSATQAREAGPRIIRDSRCRLPGRAGYAWPWPLGGI